MSDSPPAESERPTGCWKPHVLPTVMDPEGPNCLRCVIVALLEENHDYERLARDLRHALWCCMQTMNRTGPEAVSAWENGQKMLLQAADLLDD